MTRQFRRFREFDVTVQVKSDDFLQPPRPAQRTWMLKKSVQELCGELQHLDAVARSFVAGSDSVRFEDRRQARRSDQEIMEDWQIPLVTAMATIAARGGGDVLEVGYGRGVSAEVVQQLQVRSHTMVECNDAVVEAYEIWRAKHPSRDIKLLHGLWQDVTDRFETYDGILFHTYPLDEAEFLDSVVKSVTFAESFFPFAVKHLREGGSFTYVTNERDSLSRAHQRLLLEYFSSFSLSMVGPLKVPVDTKDSFWSDQMIVVDARK